jgi:SAM-dependent methyltransferase
VKPKPFVEQHASTLAPGKALDLACGDGCNALWLANHGWQVTAVDRNPTIQDARIEVLTRDLEQGLVIAPARWDLIVMSYYLQTDLFSPVVRGLKPGGMGIVIVHLFEPGHETSRFSLHPGELRDHFQPTKVVAYLEGKPTPTSRAVAQIAFTV